MAPIRLRGPNGLSTIQVPFEDDTYTVQSLQQEILKATEILPSRQLLKSGYPPTSLAVIPDLPVSSLGLKGGDQIIVSEDSSRAPAVAPPSPPVAAPAPSIGGLLPQVMPKEEGGPAYVETDGSFLIHRVVPDDNSCLFTSVALIFEQDPTKAPKMRAIVAEGIKKDTETFNEAILGRPVDEYISIIQKPQTWGGAIELTILANHYSTEIASIDVETGRIDHFTPTGADSGNRCIVIYSGIHYDAATLSPMLEAPDEWHQTVFPVKSKDDDDSVLVAGKKLADKLRERKAFTNTSTFDLKCEDCGKGLKGEKEARQHAESTGHVNFGEY
ncbi:OTU-domain-containing protein [Cylindrobasidium torrendii FP15055 ss-10]|uniref:Ubiquitin thioesterase OTU n=1 Tax=Cylindrobasidium torrendii FP15055 ss-10 TaxID=1314674 RepID=A0A0D7BDB3_9AGAR|nr:OTU-domain-containing protein [Cylindrobasidium torrendii FP15055 ss-10]